MFRRYRLWLHTRWFMKHWQVGEDFARQMALLRMARLDRDRCA